MITLKLQFDKIENNQVLTISTSYGWTEYDGEQAQIIYKFLDKFVDLIDDDLNELEAPDETE